MLRCSMAVNGARSPALMALFRCRGRKLAARQINVRMAIVGGET